MREVKTVPEITYNRPLDPWLDKVLDGKQRVLAPEDWDREQGGRYLTLRSAAAAIRQAAKQRQTAVRIQIRGDRIYVQAEVSPSSNGRKARAKKAVMSTDETTAVGA